MVRMASASASPPAARAATLPALATRSLLRAAILAVILAGCASTTPVSPPATSPAVSPAARATQSVPPPVPGEAWSKAVAVQRPDVIVSAPMPSSYFHPGHFEGQAYIVSVAPVSGGFVAVGYEWPGWRALSWRSTDGGATWALTDPGEGDDTFMNAVAADPGGTLVAVGRDGASAAAWTSTDDGRSWTRATSASFDDPAHLRMNAVASVPGGFLAGGAAGPDIGRQDARLWSSPDGLAWTAVALPDAADARVTGIAAAGGRLVAVGTRGTEREPAGSIVWVSDDGRTWRRVPTTPDLERGLMVAVTAGGPGFVAVGTDGEQYAAIVWRSTDGLAWQAVASPTFTYYQQKVRMTAVTAIPGGLVAVGNYLLGIQYGSARVWTASTRADDWQVAPDIPAFGQGEMLGVATGPGRVVAVGTFGAPDNYVPTVWVSPPLGP